MYWWHPITMFCFVFFWQVPSTSIFSQHSSQPTQICPLGSLTKVVLYSQPGKLWAVLLWVSMHFFQPLPRRANLPGWEIILFLWSLLLNCAMLCVIWLEWCKSVMCHYTSNPELKNMKGQIRNYCYLYIYKKIHRL